MREIQAMRQVGVRRIRNAWVSQEMRETWHLFLVPIVSYTGSTDYAAISINTVGNTDSYAL